ncbi:MAG: phenylalanine--tRNA ligase subunit beta [Pseudomonadota bacterium]
MKFTLSWLKDHLETEASLADITEALTDLGLEVEGVEDPAERLGAFRIARVVEAKQHPNADKLRVCDVEAWPDGPEGAPARVQVVCGAPNAKTGMRAVFAPEGAYVPGTDLWLKAGEIRGERSEGMLVSERELEISDEHDGIIELPSDAPLGVRFIDYIGLNDPVIEIAITPNRPDALGVYGIARDLAARGLGRLKDGETAPIDGAFASPIGVSLDSGVTADSEESAAACPYFVGRLIRGVKNGPSPDWMQRRLKAIGIGPKNALVDITNYVSFDRARPLHVFDAGKLEGNIKVRLSKPEESLLALDGETYVLEPGMTLICDRGGRRPAAIAGVMGGAESGCSEETTDVFVESAYFDPIRTAATGRRLKINSDARYRFDRGVDPVYTREGAELATKLILECCGGEPSDLVIAGRPPKKGRNGYERKIKLRPERLAGLVGLDIEKDEQIRILGALGFEISSPKGKTITVAPPPWRPDVHGEADLVEEVARIASLTKLTAQPMKRAHEGSPRPILTPSQRRIALARRAVATLGAHECVTYSFVSASEARLFGGGDPAMTLENPIAADKSDMRPSLLPGLLAAAARNQARGLADAALFEVGPVFFGPEPGEQQESAAILRVGAAAPRDWSGARRPIDLYDAKADAEALLSALGVDVDKLMIDRETPGWWHPGRSGRLKLGPKTVLAEFGELHPKAARALGVKGAAAGSVVFLEAIPAPKAKSTARPALSLPDLQPVERDFAFIVSERTEAAAILRAARGANKKLITDARVFDVFEGAKAAAQLGEGQKSVAISVTLQPTEKTLTNEEIEAVAAAVLAAVDKAVGAKLRA